MLSAVETVSPSASKEKYLSTEVEEKDKKQLIEQLWQSRPLVSNISRYAKSNIDRYSRANIGIQVDESPNND